MSFLDCILPSYNYLYVSKKNEVKTKSLNLFQCFLRKAFGAYEKTHLQNFVQAAYPLTFKKEFTCDYYNSLLVLIALKKAQNLYHSKAELCTQLLPSGTELTVSGDYKIVNAGRDGTKKISAISFSFSFKKESIENVFWLSIAKSDSNDLEAQLPEQFLARRAEDKPAGVLERANQEEIKAVNDFVNDLLINSATEQFSYIGKSYFDIPANLRKKRREKLDAAQTNLMEQLHWKLDPTFKEETNDRRFIYTKEEALKIKDKPNHTVSIDFPSHFLQRLL